MFSSEKAFDMLPSVVVLYDKLDIDGYSKKIREGNKGKKEVDNQALGIDLVKYVLKNSAKIKEEVFEVVAVVEEKTVEEIKAQDFMKTINTIKEIFSDKETVSFLTQAMG
jgi:hypothetical protein